MLTGRRNLMTYIPIIPYNPLPPLWGPKYNRSCQRRRPFLPGIASNRAVSARTTRLYPLRVKPGAGQGPESRGSGGFTRICAMLDVVEVRTGSLLPALLVLL